MARKLRTKKGRAVYSRRKAIVEPVFGQIDTVQNGRRLLLRGREAARAEWRLHCACHNLLKLFRAGGLALLERKQPGKEARWRRPGERLALAAQLLRPLRRAIAVLLAALAELQLPAADPLAV